MKTQHMLFVAFFVFVGLVIAWAVYDEYLWRPSADMAPFASCLKDKGFTMYGAYWCPHCKNEKKPFGDAWGIVPYVECTQKPEVCEEKGVKGYPTWITDGGQKYEGEQGIKKLSELSGCPLPEGAL